MLPRVPGTYSQERIGISAIAFAAANLSQIWRETSTGDVGIDGQLEFVNSDGFATGRTLGVQVKSGPSYFTNEDTNSFHFYPSDKHRLYWERYPIPVLLILHNPEQNRSYWVDARQMLRSPESAESAFIRVPKSNVLQTSTPQQLFESAGVMPDAFIPGLIAVAAKLTSTRSYEKSFPISYLDLFAFGLTNITRSLYYGMDLIASIAEANITMLGYDVGLGIGDVEHKFAFSFLKFIVAQNLADIDFADCLIDFEDRAMHPTLIAPLTARGRELVTVLDASEDRLIELGKLPKDGLRVAQEGFVEMVSKSYVQRLPRVLTFHQLMNGHPKPAMP